MYDHYMYSVEVRNAGHWQYSETNYFTLYLNVCVEVASY
jgi:hypothetical protein